MQLMRGVTERKISMKRQSLRKWAMLLPVLLGVGIAAGAGNAAIHRAPETCLKASLTGSAISGVMPKGKAEFCSETEEQAVETELEVEVEKVNLADGTMLTVKLNRTNLGTITLKQHRGALHLRSETGDVPVAHKGDMVSVSAGNRSVVASGKF